MYKTQRDYRSVKYTTEEVAQFVGWRWFKDGLTPSAIMTATQSEIQARAPLNRREYTPRTWHRVRKLAMAHAERQMAGSAAPL